MRAKLPMPKSPQPQPFFENLRRLHSRLVSGQTPSLGSAAKINGSSKMRGIDSPLSRHAVFAVVARCPVFGGKVKSVRLRCES